MYPLFYRRLSSMLIVSLVLGISLYAQDKLTPETLMGLKAVSSSSISPDGKMVAYTVTVPNMDTSKPARAKSEVWVRNIKSGDSRQFIGTPLSGSRLSWSTDSKHLYFLAKVTTHSATTQVYSIPVAGGMMNNVTDHSAAISNYSWSADGNWLAYISTDAKTADEKAAIVRGEDWKDYDTNYKYPRLYVMNAKTGESKQISGETTAVWAMAWSPDNTHLAIQTTDKPLVDESMMFGTLQRISRVDGSTIQLCETEGKLGVMRFSPDGMRLAFLGATSLNDPLAQTVFTVPANGGSALNISGASLIKGSASTISWMNNKNILLQAAEGATTTLSILAANGSKRKVFRDNIIKRSHSLHAKSGTIAVVGETPGHPRELFIGNVKNGLLKKQTDHNPILATTALGRQEVMKWKAEDGMDIEGILTYPLNYTSGTSYPLVLQIHGGPEGVSQNGWNTRMLYPTQLLAAEGYFVLEPNYRGSGGYGVEFSKADHDDLGGKEFDDVLAGIDMLIEKGMVDGSRVGTGGWSYGGFFSAWAATKHSDRFKAAAVCAGLTNWISFSGTTDIPHEMALVHWNHYWYEQRELHMDRSPIYHINNAKTATLIIHGDIDARVHPEQSIQLYGALKLKNVPTKLVTYPREGHGLAERAHQMHYMENLINWFNTYVRDSAETKNDEASLN
ncbi:MAG: S9 family peptidase [Calditrichia bacterium]